MLGLICCSIFISIVTMVWLPTLLIPGPRIPSLPVCILQSSTILSRIFQPYPLVFLLFYPLLVVADVANDFQKETLDLNNKFFLDDDGSVQHPAIYHSFETGGSTLLSFLRRIYVLQHIFVFKCWFRTLLSLLTDRLIAMQRLAHAIGVGFYDSTFYTVVHEKFGPWVSL